MRRSDRENRLLALEGALKVRRIPSHFIQLGSEIDQLEGEPTESWLTRVIAAGGAVLELRLFEKNRFHSREHPRGIDITGDHDPAATWAKAQGIDVTGKPDH